MYSRELHLSKLLAVLTLFALSGMDSVAIRHPSNTTNFTLAPTNGNTVQGCIQPPTGLLSWWPGDGNASDIWGGNNGTLINGATFGVGKVAQAFSFDGVDDYIEVGPQPSLVMTDTMTMDAWIYPTGPGSEANGAIIINKEGEYELYRHRDGDIGWAFGNADPGWVNTDTGHIAPENQWTHIAVVYNLGLVQTYANGVLIHQYEGSGTIGDVDPVSNDFRISNRDWFTEIFDGLIDEVDIFNRALSGAEILAIYNAGESGKCHSGTDVYSISGRVTSDSGSPVSGVSVTAGSSKSAVTDAGGIYTITSLITGTYTITPNKSGYTFSPPSRTVSVPPSAVGQNFTGTLATPSGKPVVVLVHGWQGIGPRQVSCNEGITLYPRNQNFDDENAPYIGDMPDWLNNQGFEVWSAHLTTGPDYTAPLRDNAKCLRDQIALVRDRAPDKKVILIAHSMGGLVARAYMENDGLYQDDVKTLITLGTPHQGVPVRFWVTLNKYLKFKNLTCSRQPAMCEFTQGIDTFNRDYARRARGTDYYLVSGDLSIWNTRGLAYLLSAIVPGSDDGIVPTTSGLGLLGAYQTLQTGEAHIKDFGLYSYFGPPPGDMFSFAYADCIQPVLAGKRDGCQFLVAMRHVTQFAQSDSSALVPVAEGLLTTGQTITRTVYVDESNPALFASTWVTNPITFTIISPVGQTIDPSYAIANPTQAAYASFAPDASLQGASYLVYTPTIGLWTLKVEAGSLPPEGSTYSILATFDSSVALAGGTDKLWYSPSATASITATLSGSPVSAVITAAILRADGITDTVPLSSVGAGQYQGAYTVPNAPGHTEVRLVATGTLTGGLAFERGETLLFQISPNSAALGNTYSESVQPHPIFSSLYQALTVTVGVNSTISGTLGLSADLVDASDNFVAHGLTIQDVVTGTTTLALRFDGADIFASQRNGPYKLTNVLLTDQTGATLVLAEAQDVYTTAPYQYTAFATPMALYLPLIQR